MPPGAIRVAVDVIIEVDEGRIVLIARRNPPIGWALPGGFVEGGETLEAAAVREAREETGLGIQLVRQFHAYSDPARDPRGRTIATVFLARARGTPRAHSDARDVGTFARDDLPAPLVFDHAQILEDYYARRH
ncbi:MAG: NUDIX domain-containing protein [Candidatus Rokuibacteriota bacterium]